jgi:hypothetical protein
MARWTTVGVASIVATSGVLWTVVCCGGCLALVWPVHRTIGVFDLGDGLTVHVWSESAELSPAMYFRVDSNGVEVVPQTYIGGDQGQAQRFEFRTATAAGGGLRCLYEATRAVKDDMFLIVYVPDTKECWPRLQDLEWIGDAAVAEKWRKRFQRLWSENPGFPANRFSEGAKSIAPAGK